MSRTDVHRPGWVKERDPFLRHLFAEDHDHSKGPCDLAVRLANPHLPWPATRCRMRYVGSRNIFCGCRLCTSHHEQRAERRRDRHRAKAQLRKLPDVGKHP